MRSAIVNQYSLVLLGHEHEPIGIKNKAKDSLETCIIQGNALYGHAPDGNGFFFIDIDSIANTIIGTSYIWDEDIFKPEKELEEKISMQKGKELKVRGEYLERLEKDSQGRSYDSYYTFPEMEYRAFDKGDNIESFTINSEQELLSVFEKNCRINICGDHKSGKSVLASRMYRELYKKGNYPILIRADEIQKQNIKKTIKYGFDDQYIQTKNAYERFLQIDRKKKYVLVDDASKIEKNILDELVKVFDRCFETIILFSEDKIGLDIRRQVLEVVNEKNIVLTIEPFLYTKRRNLISNVLTSRGLLLLPT